MVNSILDSNLPKLSLQDITLIPETCDLESFTICNEYKTNLVNHIQNGHGLYIYSEKSGTGKTSWALKISFEQIINNGWKYVTKDELPVYYVNVVTLFEELRSNMDNKDYISNIEKNILGASLVIFDDIGVEAPTTWVKNKLYMYINERYMLNKSMIFTSNYNIQQLAARLDDRIADRISEKCRPIQFVGVGRRNEKRWWN